MGMIMSAILNALPDGSRMTATMEKDAAVVLLRTALEEADHRRAKYYLLPYVVIWSLGEAFGICFLFHCPVKRFVYFVIVWLTIWSVALALLVWFFLLTLRPYRPWRFVVSDGELTFYQGSEASYPFYGQAAGGIGFTLPSLFRRIEPVRIKRSKANDIEVREKSRDGRKYWD